MATGYTADIHDGKPVTFPEFAMECARAFGALISMRDEPKDAVIPESFAPSDYYRNSIKAATDEIARLRSLSLEQATEEARAEHADATARWQARKENRAALLARYEAMLAEVSAWEPPTPEHQGLKDFMAQQLQSSIDHDCDGSYDREPELMTAPDWLARHIDLQETSLGYDLEHQAEGEQLAAERTVWVRSLRDSLAAAHADAE